MCSTSCNIHRILFIEQYDSLKIAYLRMKLLVIDIAMSIKRRDLQHTDEYYKFNRTFSSSEYSTLFSLLFKWNFGWLLSIAYLLFIYFCSHVKLFISACNCINLSRKGETYISLFLYKHKIYVVVLAGRHLGI